MSALPADAVEALQASETCKGKCEVVSAEKATNLKPVAHMQLDELWCVEYRYGETTNSHLLARQGKLWTAERALEEDFLAVGCSNYEFHVDRKS